MESGDEMTTPVPQYSLEERLRAVMGVLGAVAALELLFIGYSVFRGQGVSYSTGLLAAVFLGLTLGAFLGARMKESSTALRIGVLVGFGVAAALAVTILF